MADAPDAETRALIDEIIDLVRLGAFPLDDKGKLTTWGRKTVGSLLFLAQIKSPSLREALEQAWDRVKIER